MSNESNMGNKITKFLIICAIGAVTFLIGGFLIKLFFKLFITLVKAASAVAAMLFSTILTLLIIATVGWLVWRVYRNSRN